MPWPWPRNFGLDHITKIEQSGQAIGILLLEDFRLHAVQKRPQHTVHTNRGRLDVRKQRDLRDSWIVLAMFIFSHNAIFIQPKINRAVIDRSSSRPIGTYAPLTKAPQRTIGYMYVYFCHSEVGQAYTIKDYATVIEKAEITYDQNLTSSPLFKRLTLRQ